MRDDPANDRREAGDGTPRPRGRAGSPGTRGGAIRGPRRQPPHVAIVVYDGLAIFEFGVACDIFALDRSEVWNVPWYRTSICAWRAGTVHVDGGLQLTAPHGLAALSDVDTVVVPPTEQPDDVPTSVLDALRRAHRRGSRIVALCTGAFVVAAAGLLDGRRAATHWSSCDELARRHPSVAVDPAVLYVDDGDILTSAGSAASIDLCLHVVRRDYGADIAARLARELVVPPHRDGDQAQFIETPLPTQAVSDLLGDTMVWMQEHLDETITVDDLARQSAMSRRTFARRFSAATGTTPLRWLLGQRIQRAQRLLETTQLPIELVAARSGFASAANLRKHFGTYVRTSPQAYRRAFRGAPVEPGKPSPRR